MKNQMKTTFPMETHIQHSKPSEVSERVASMAKLSARKALLQAALPKSCGFLDESEQWLTKVEAKLASSDPLSL